MAIFEGQNSVVFDFRRDVKVGAERFLVSCEFLGSGHHGTLASGIIQDSFAGIFIIWGFANLLIKSPFVLKCNTTFIYS